MTTRKQRFTVCFKYTSGNRAAVAFLFATAFLAIVGGYKYAWRWEDAYWYTEMASGRMARVIAPFSSRPLAPSIVYWASRLFGITVEHSFFWFGVFSVGLLAGLVGFLLTRNSHSSFLLYAVAFTAFWPLSFENYLLPDLFNSTLLCLFITLLFKKQYLWSSLLLFPLGISRESVLMIAFCLLVAGWRELRWPTIMTAAGATAFSVICVKWLARNSMPNRHHLGFLIYIVAKIPWNLATNVLGIAPWSNDLHTYCGTPLWSANLPVHLGGIGAFGYCGYLPALQLKWLCSALCIFGIFPILLCVLVRRTREFIWPDSVFLKFCILYGGVSFCLAPLLGSAVDRLIGYSWPLLLIAVPVQASKVFDFSLLPRDRLLAMHCAISWFGFQLEHGSSVRLLSTFLVLVVLPVYWYSYRKLSSTPLLFQ